MKYFRKVEKPQSEKSLSGAGGWEEIETLIHTVQLGGESCQKRKKCANPVSSLNKLSEKSQNIYLCGTQEKILYEDYKVSQNNIQEYRQNVKN